jgi:release factor glutamine methyltransferase
MMGDGEPCAGTTVGEARRWATGLLATSSETPRLDAEVLLAHVLEVGRTALLTDRSQCLDPAQAEQFTGMVRRRLKGEPVAYLTGRRAFYDVELAVDARVLVPRPETELLVETALSWARSTTAQPLQVVDVGTGSGALAIVLAKHLPGASVIATDLSGQALEVAAANVARLELGDRVTLVRCDLLACLDGPIELIVSNPPYVPRDRLPSLPADVRLYEPHGALDGGDDGLELISRLLHQATSRLARPGLLLVEIDETQGPACHALASDLWPQAEVSVLRDLAGLDRVLRVELVG